MPHPVAVLNIVVSKARGVRWRSKTLVSYLRKHRFVHGNAQVDGRIVSFFYFEDADTGAAHADSRNSRPRWRLCGSTQKAACPTHAAIACTQPQRLSRAIRQVRINRVCRTALNACITFEPAQLSQEVSSLLSESRRSVENLFARPKAFDLPDWNAGEPALNALHVNIGEQRRACEGA